MNIYLIMYSIVIIFGVIFGGYKKYNYTYIIIVGIILFSVCAFRGVRVGSDLGTYEKHYLFCYNNSWANILNYYGTNNVLFYFIMKAQSLVFGYSYSIYLALLAIFEGIVLCKLIAKYSVNPFMSFVMYMSLGYYIFIYSGLKQALAMAFIMIAFDKIIEKKAVKFIFLSFIAACIHVPALIFLPAYFFARKKVTFNTVMIYIVGGCVLYFLKGNIVNLMAYIYASDVSDASLSNVGGKAVMMFIIIVIGMIFRNPKNEDIAYTVLFNCMIVAMMLQTLASYGNVFERLADYYYVFAILFIPMIFENVNVRDVQDDQMIKLVGLAPATVSFGILIFATIYFYITLNSTYGILPYALSFI
ncbi:MAG: EpsG family protein [Eubacteriales bacterium]